MVSEWHPPNANIIEKDLHLESFDCTVLWSELTGNLLTKIFSFMIKRMQELDELDDTHLHTSAVQWSIRLWKTRWVIASWS